MRESLGLVDTLHVSPILPSSAKTSLYLSIFPCLPVPHTVSCTNRISLYRPFAVNPFPSAWLLTSCARRMAAHSGTVEYAVATALPRKRTKGSYSVCINTCQSYTLEIMLQTPSAVGSSPESLPSAFLLHLATAIHAMPGIAPPQKVLHENGESLIAEQCAHSKSLRGRRKPFGISGIE